VEESAVGVVVAGGLVIERIVIVDEQFPHHVTLELADEPTHVLSHTSPPYSIIISIIIIIIIMSSL